MTIEIAPGVAQRLVEHYSAAVLQVRTAETAAATRALDAAIEAIWALGEGVELPHLDPDEPVSPKYISKVVPTPHGPMVTFDFGEDFPPELIERIPDLIVAALRTEGVTDGTVCCPREGGALTRLYWNSNASPPYPCGAGLRLWAPARREVPDSWIELALAWLSGAGDPHRVSFSWKEFPVDRDLAPTLLRQVADARSGACLMVAGDLGERVRTACLSTIFTNRLDLVERGPGVSDADQLQAAAELADLGREIAGDVEYAAVDFDVAEGFESMRQHRGHHNGWFDHWGTELVDGPFWWQLLGEGHLARMADPAAVTPLATPGRYELIHGEPEQWLPDRPSRAQLQQGCRDLLGHCFIADAIRNPDGPGLILPPVPR
ncbi:MAG TPA: hypothetical protein VJ914_40625 [Pseudonocardiaceae bacterium]|nr:hypothetical protein [Pseudonocardiaceae bacterium]